MDDTETASNRTWPDGLLSSIREVASVLDDSDPGDDDTRDLIEELSQYVNQLRIAHSFARLGSRQVKS